MIARHKNAPDPGWSLRTLVEQPSPKDCSRGTIPFGLLHCNRKPALGKGNAPTGPLNVPQLCSSVFQPKAISSSRETQVAPTQEAEK